MVEYYKDGGLIMGKVLCFMYDQMVDFEVSLALFLIGANSSNEIFPIAYENKPVKTYVGVEFVPKATVGEALNFQDVEALVIPGGWGDEQRPELTKLVQKLNNEKKLLAAICAGPQYLARAGVLEGRKYTTTLSHEGFKEKGIADPFPRSTFVNENVVVDGNIITAVGSSFVDFAMELCDRFKLFENLEEKLETAQVYKGMR